MQHKSERSVAEQMQATGTAATAGADRGAGHESSPAPAAASSSSAQQSSPVDPSAAPSHTPASFFSSSLSSTDSAYHRIAVLYCPGCLYLEFPGCLMHNGLLANIKGQ